MNGLRNVFAGQNVGGLSFDDALLLIGTPLLFLVIYCLILVLFGQSSDK